MLPYQPEWAARAATLAAELRALLPDALAVEHIGSTSSPGMSAKACIDMMIVVDYLEASRALPVLTAAGGKLWPKLVFAPPIGAPRCNIHMRLAGAETTRLARLFRDYLHIHPDKVQLWSAFKLKVTAAAPDLSAYGQIKAPAWLLLMELAEVWDRARQEK